MFVMVKKLPYPGFGISHFLLAIIDSGLDAESWLQAPPFQILIPSEPKSARKDLLFGVRVQTGGGIAFRIACRELRPRRAVPHPDAERAEVGDELRPRRSKSRWR